MQEKTGDTEERLQTPHGKVGGLCLPLGRDVGVTSVWMESEP